MIYGVIIAIFNLKTVFGNHEDEEPSQGINSKGQQVE